jgi:hypothetical protein
MKVSNRCPPSEEAGELPNTGGQRCILAGPARRCRQLGTRPELGEEGEACGGEEGKAGGREGGGGGHELFTEARIMKRHIG